MDNEFHDLEAELKRLRPVAPSSLLTSRVERTLRVPQRRGLWAWAALPLAASLAGIVFLRDKPAAKEIAPQAATPAAAVATYKPVSADNVLYDLRDEGLVTLADGTPARRYRSSYVDTITWKNPRTQASLRWSMPRSEERVIPVSFQ